MSSETSPSAVDATVSRRTFFKQAAGAAALIGFPTIVPSTVFGANAPSNRITIGGIGMGSQGMSNMKAFLGLDRVQWLAVCDVDSRHLADAKSEVDGHHGNRDCRGYRDFRELLSRDDIDAISMATADHWHALTAIAAASAGKDVYGEKPLSHDMREGRAIVRAVETHGRVWQTGSWQRSQGNFHHASELVRNGRLGKVTHVEVGLPDGRSGPVRGVEPVPEQLDWDMWLGPAPEAPYRGFCHGNWRWVLDWGGGQIGDWIGHHMDIANWALNLEGTGPVEVKGKGVFPTQGVFDAPTEYRIECRYQDGLTVTVANESQLEKGMGTRWIGEDGRWIWVDRGKQETNPPELWRERIGSGETRLYQSNDHFGNFLDCVRSRRAAVAPVEAAHRAASVGHLGTIAILTGRTIKWDPSREEIMEDPGANALLGRAYRAPWSLA